MSSGLCWLRVQKTNFSLFAPWPWQQQVGGTASCRIHGKLDCLTKVASEPPLGSDFLSKQAVSLRGGQHILGQLACRTAGTPKRTRGAARCGYGCSRHKVAILVAASEMLHLIRYVIKRLTLILTQTQPPGSLVGQFPCCDLHLSHSKIPLVLGRENILSHFLFTPLSCDSMLLKLRVTIIEGAQHGDRTS